MTKLDWEKANRKRKKPSEREAPVLGSDQPVERSKPFDQGIEPRRRDPRAMSMADAIEAVREHQRESYKKSKRPHKGVISAGR